MTWATTKTEETKMATAREHLSNNHQKEQSHWHTFAKGLSELAGHVYDMHKKHEMAGPCKAGETCDKLAGLAEAHADYHRTQVEACMKAADDDLNKLVPTLVSGIAPERTSGRAVLRAGSPPMQPVTIDPQFSKILGTSEEDLHSEEPSLMR
jgi:hypothetical protein